MLLQIVAPWHSVKAQSAPDFQAPIIELEALAQSPADDSQVFSARVIDDRAIKDVTVYIRRQGQLPFQPYTMTAIANTDYYSASVSTDPTDLRAIEYYLQARDEGGNRTVSGFAFDPYRRDITAAGSPLPTLSAEQQRRDNVPAGGLDEVDTDRRGWWRIALGVLAVGTLAALASSSGDSNNSGSALGDPPGQVPLTIDLTTPQP